MSENTIPNNTKEPVEQTLLDNLGKISYTLDRTYLSRLESDYGVLPFAENYNHDEQISYVSNIRALRIKRCVLDKEEKVSDCFKNILALFANSEDTLALVLRRLPNCTEMYFVVKNIGKCRNEDSKNNIELLADSIRGNFPGTEVDVIEEKNSGGDTRAVFSFEKAKAVSVLSNVPSEKSEDFLCQGIEKLIDGVVPKTAEDSYDIVFLMESIPLEEVRNILSGYEEIATAITPFTSYQFQTGENKTDTQGEMESMTHTEGVSHAITKTHSVNVGVNGGLFSSKTKSGSVGVRLGIFNGGGNLAKAKGANVGASLGYGYSWGTTDTKNSSDGKTTGTNHSVSLGKSKSTTYTYKSYMVSDIISKLEAVIKRIDESKATGLWRYAAYVMSSKTKTTINVANYLRSISQGNESFVEPSFIQNWSYEESKNVTAFNEILKYVSHFCHPVFANIKDGTLVMPSIEASTTELSNIVAFPRHSVQKLPVLECVRFGREPQSLNALKGEISIGCTYHMHQKGANEIFINKQELTKHTFITGSTGSGKSNAIYSLLDKLCLKDEKNDTKFLIIEPAKGEYKDFFGGRNDVTTYGTNPFKFPNLLQINPFSFPEDIHVLEHIDRLVEVFNACWPMYAAMPAILKEAIEKSYERVDWNLKLSKNPGRFPTFETLLAVLPEVVESSQYSLDTSSDYKGALLTRVRSLTRGIQGQIFKDDTSAECFFNQNAIVDISRVGSSETKALIMGILILKLQEFRMSEENKCNNKELCHVTVLEEAHNLLRRTSSEQSQETSNIQGKSVEMLANAIAEMRTYGEGFIIADQSPGLMDMSVIRNTNTKIILRLPDESDRLLVGKAAGLSDLQITELARLEVGVAAISQSDWLEPVLCKIDKFNDGVSLEDRFKGDKEKPCVNGKFDWWSDNDNSAIKEFLEEVFKPADIERIKLSQDVVDKVRAWCDTAAINDSARKCVELALEGYYLEGVQKMIIASAITGNKIIKIPNREKAIMTVTKALVNQYNFMEDDEIIRRINDLFFAHFPVNIYTDRAENIKNEESGVK